MKNNVKLVTAEERARDRGRVSVADAARLLSVSYARAIVLCREGVFHTWDGFSIGRGDIIRHKEEREGAVAAFVATVEPDRVYTMAEAADLLGGTVEALRGARQAGRLCCRRVEYEGVRHPTYFVLGRRLIEYQSKILAITHGGWSGPGRKARRALE